MSDTIVKTKEKIVTTGFQVDWPVPLAGVKPVFNIVVSDKGDYVLVYFDSEPEQSWKKYIVHRCDPSGKIVCESYASSVVNLKLHIDSLARDLAVIYKKQTRTTRRV
jgi:hypothetical protein